MPGLLVSVTRPRPSLIPSQVLQLPASKLKKPRRLTLTWHKGAGRIGLSAPRPLHCPAEDAPMTAISTAAAAPAPAGGVAGNILGRRWANTL